MSAPCAVNSDEIKRDIKSSLDAVQWSILRSELRMEVISTAERLVRGETVSVFRYGERYTQELVQIDVSEHKLFGAALLSCYNGDHMPMNDLVTRISQNVVATAWYGEADADDLGFSK